MKWTTKDGRTLNIKDMSTLHLRNAVAMLRREGFVSEEDFLVCLGAASSLRGEMASMYAEQEAYGMKVSPALGPMEEELASREVKS